MIQRLYWALLLPLILTLASCSGGANANHDAIDNVVDRHLLSFSDSKDVMIYNYDHTALRKLTDNEKAALEKLAAHGELTRYQDDEIASDITYFYFIVGDERWYIYHDSLYSDATGRRTRVHADGVTLLWSSTQTGDQGMYPVKLDFSELIAWADKH